MRAVLTSEVSVSRIAVFAEMAWMERRPELGALCRAAREGGNRISAATVQSVLPGLQDAGAANVLGWCRMLGLCDDRGGLTALGEDVAERDEAPVPEQGVYGLWLAEHPVLGRRVLAVERLASNRDHRFESIDTLPIEPDRGKVFRSVVDSKERFQVRDLPTNHGQAACLRGETRATCSFRWTLDFDSGQDQWQLDGAVEVPQGKGKYAMRAMKHEPERDGIDLWGLAATWGIGPLSSFGRWQASERRLAVAFQGLGDAEQDSFRKTLPLRHVEVPGKGSYDDVSLEDVPVGPASASDAQHWAMSRFDRHLSKHPGYRSRAAVRELFADLTEETPLERFSPTLPAHDELLGGRDATKDPDRFWSLAAPVDLAPRAVTADDLGPLRVGSPAAVTAAEPPGVVRVPYRGGWSMRRLVDRLLAGTAPRKVLLCDRYVRGSENLTALKLLVESVREVGPSVAVEVWTGDEDADFKQIQALTGAPARSYREVFGRNLPHDRYLLVLPSHGAGFGWHMSNSPLHARPDVNQPTPESPLRWKDFAGTRVAADELEPALRQWLNGGGR